MEQGPHNHRLLQHMRWTSSTSRGAGPSADAQSYVAVPLREHRNTPTLARSPRATPGQRGTARAGTYIPQSRPGWICQQHPSSGHYTKRALSHRRVLTTQQRHPANRPLQPYSKLNPVHSGKSTHSVKSNMTEINAQHIVDIIQFSFDACAFTAIGEVFRQTCGTSMGNQISPILSTCAIVATEITWLRLFGQHVASAHLADQLWIRRYVDNRAIIVDKDVLHTNPYIWQLASLQFYKKPVQLEDENCDDFLGFRINANNRQVSYSYILHSQPWRYRLSQWPQSAGSRKLRLSGYHSRRHMIESTVFPQSLAQQQLQALDDLYFKLGFRDLAEGVRQNMA